MVKLSLVPVYLLILFFLSPAGFAVAPDDSAMQRMLESEARLKGNLLDILDQMSRDYRTPISIEWSPVNSDDQAPRYPSLNFTLEKGTTLSTALDQLVTECDGQIIWERIRGIICVRSAIEAGSPGGLLDVPVTLELGNASPWKAFAALARAVNSAADRSQILVPRANPVQDEYFPPRQLLEENTISLKLESVTAREAICAIMVATSMQMSFRYHSAAHRHTDGALPLHSELSLWAYDQNYQVLSHTSPRDERPTEMLRWHNETRSVIEDARKAYETPADSIEPENTPRE